MNRFAGFILLAACLLLPAIVFSQGKTYTIVFLNSRSEAEELDEARGKQLMEAHLDNIGRLAEEGKLLIAGPFLGGGGMFVMNTSSIEEARTWIATDPAVQAGRWNIELLPYTPRRGSICPVKGENEYVEYTFVRFNAIVEKFNASSYPQLIRQHEAFIKKNIASSDIVTEAIFGPNEGGVLVLRNKADRDTFLSDPAVQNGLIDVDIRKLYIARTSFCEP